MKSLKSTKEGRRVARERGNATRSLVTECLRTDHGVSSPRFAGSTKPKTRNPKCTHHGQSHSHQQRPAVCSPSRAAGSRERIWPGSTAETAVAAARRHGSPSTRFAGNPKHEIRNEERLPPVDCAHSIGCGGSKAFNCSKRGGRSVSTVFQTRVQSTLSYPCTSR